MGCSSCGKKKQTTKKQASTSSTTKTGTKTITVNGKTYKVSG